MKGTQEGRSFGSYEISARKSSVPAPRRTRAKTSFHAVFLKVRATAAHSNATESPFNFIPRKARVETHFFDKERRLPNRRGKEGGSAERRPTKRWGRSCAVGRDAVEPKTLTAPQSVALPSEQSDVRRFPSTPRFPPCAPQGSALTLRRVMRLLLRRVGLTLAAGLLIFCCSCERHRVGELPAEHHTKSSEIDTTKPDAAPSPAARSSPANFFPDKRKP